MFIDTQEQICDLDGKVMWVEQNHDLAPKGRVLVVDGKELILESAEDLDGRIVLIDGNPRMKGGKPMTFGYVAVLLLRRELKGDEQLTEAKKLDMWVLALKIHGKHLPVELSETETQVLLDRGALSLPKETFWGFSAIVRKARVAALEITKPNGVAAEVVKS